MPLMRISPSAEGGSIPSLSVKPQDGGNECADQSPRAETKGSTRMSWHPNRFSPTSLSISTSRL